MIVEVQLHLNKESSDYLSWYAGHNQKCGITYGGSSPSKEPAGAVRIYEGSAESLNLQYTGFIGDGDTKSYSSVVDKHPNGHKVEIVKKECWSCTKEMWNRFAQTENREWNKETLKTLKHSVGKGVLQIYAWWS